MPALSSRILGLNAGGSDGWEVFYRGREMAARGLPVIELTIGEHDIRTDSAILDAMHESAMGGHTGYALVPGTPGLRDRIADRVRRRTGVPTGRDNVLVTPGGQAGLFAAHMAVCAPGDAALYIDPFYATYPGTIRGASARAVPILTRAEDGFLPDPDAVDRAAVESGATSLLINTPNNPTGAVYPVETLEALARVARARDLWIISDEVYDSQVWDGTHLSPRALPGMADRTLVIGSMSKSHAMTGSRMGWVIGPEPAVAAMIDLATNTTYGTPGFIQDAAAYALDRGDAPEAVVSEPFRRRRDKVLALLAQQDAVGVIPSQGAMYLMLDIRRTGLSGRDFAERLLDTHQIAVMPGESFGVSAAGHLRVALTVADDRLLDAIGTLCSFARGMAAAA